MDNQQATQSMPTAAPVPQTGQSLFKQSWQSFKKNMSAIWIAAFITNLLSYLAGLFLSAGLTKNLPLAQSVQTPNLSASLVNLPAPISYIIAAILMIAGVWFMVATLKIIRGQANNLSVALTQSTPLIIPAILLGLLVYLITMGGTILLIVPGIILAIWFTFTFFVLVDNQGSGFTALMKSKALVKGKWWEVLGTIIALGLVIGIITMIIFWPISLATKGGTIGMIIYAIIYVLWLSFSSAWMLVYFNNYYNKLKAEKGVLQGSISGGLKTGLILLAILGVIVWLGLMSLQRWALNNIPANFDPNTLDLNLNTNAPMDANSVPQFDEEQFRKLLEAQGINLDDLPTNEAQ